MKFYLNNSATPLRVEIEPTLTDVLDETLDSVGLTLAANDVAEPYAPLQRLTVDLEDENHTQVYFLLVTDNVEIFSLTKSLVCYKHHLVFTQNTRILSKHLVRNTAFTQPANKYKESMTATSCGLTTIDVNADYYGNTLLVRSYFSGLTDLYEGITLNAKEKVFNAYIEIDVQIAVSDQNQPTKAKWMAPEKTLAAINSHFSYGSLSINGTPTLIYVNANNQTVSEPLSSSDYGGTIYFNTPIKCDRVKEILNAGGKDIRLCFGTTTAVFSSNTYNVFELPLTGNFNLTKGSGPSYVMCQCKIKVETYYYTAYDILDLLLKRQKQVNSLGQKEPLFKLPASGELYDLLKQTIAPNFFFTQNTMFECVTEVFRLFDATFTMSADGTLGIEYFNNLDVDDRTDDIKLIGKQMSLGEDKYVNGLDSYYQDAYVEEFYPGKNQFASVRSENVGVPEQSDYSFIVSHPIQSVIKCFVKYMDGVNIYNGYTTDGSKTRSSDNQTLNIVLVEENNTSSYLIPKEGLTLDLTLYLVETSIWSTLDISGTVDLSDPLHLQQANTINYTSGENKVQLAFTYKTSWGNTIYSFQNAMRCAANRQAGLSALGESYGPQDFAIDWTLIRLCLQYYSKVDGRVRVESLKNKYDGEALVDQSSGALDLNKLGLNMLGVVLKMGEPTLEAKLNLKNINKRIKKGEIYKYNGEIWIANSITYKILNNGVIEENISFIKNFNALALRTKLIRERRFSEIDRNLVMKSEEIMSDYCYLSSKAEEITDDTIHIKSAFFNSAMRETFDNVNGNTEIKYAAFQRVTSATVTRTENLIYDRYEIHGNAYFYYYLTPSIDLTAVVNLEFHLNYNDPNHVVLEADITYNPITNMFNATFVYADERDEQYVDGISVTYSYSPDGNYVYIPFVKYGAGNAVCIEMSFNDPMSAGNKLTVKTGWFSATNKYLSQAVKYTDSNGFADLVGINFLMEYPNTNWYTFDRFPEIQLPSSVYTIGAITDLYFYKQPNEIFALNYEIVFLSKNINVDFVGNEFINNFALIKELDKNRKFYLYYTTSENKFQYSVLDTKGHGSDPKLISSINLSANRLQFNFSATNDIKTWAICDENGNIYFASNESSGIGVSSSNKSIYFYTKKNRI
jgi:hypothetical protein